MREGWREAGGAFDLGPRATQGRCLSHRTCCTARGAHVFDAFGEPSGRVKAVRDGDFLLARPFARDVYVPFSAIRWPGRLSLRIGVPNAQLGSKAWEQPKLLGLFNGSRSPGADPEPDSSSTPKSAA